MPTVFRWNITRREQLGRLVEGEPVELHPAMLDELRLCGARVIAMAGDARLVFIGRSPEHLYDGWRAVRRQLRIVGITERRDHGPKTWRWRSLEWAARFRPSALKGVSVPYWFWTHLGDSETKASRANPPTRWTDPEMARPPRGPDFAEALRLAVTLHDVGRTRAERDTLAAAISAQPAVRYPWRRVLAAELRAASRPKRVERVFASKQRVRSWRRHERIRSYARGR